MVRGLRWHPSWTLYGLPLVRQARRGCIVVGPHWTACSVARHNSIGVFQPVILRVTTPTGRIQVGRNVGMSGCSIAARVSVEIGDDVLIGSGALITDSDAHGIHPDERHDPAKIRAAAIRIGNNVFVGARSIILKGVTIGEGAVIGAGAVVSKDVPSFAIVVGNPARVVGDSRTA
jgi:acetyltransferase-like isoleucine patch superfamily enzyme